GLLAGGVRLKYPYHTRLCRGDVGVDERRCPRCGLPYNWVETHKVRGRLYVYAVHRLDRLPSGRYRVKKCYLGPKDHYVAVTRMHQDIGLVFRGMLDRERVLDYLETIIRYVEGSPRVKERERVLTLLREALRLLERDV
ncbi:MAG: hypothetical protein ACTSXC_03075, partial [Candidatus Freyarchaeota archaeon]